MVRTSSSVFTPRLRFRNRFLGSPARPGVFKKYNLDFDLVYIQAAAAAAAALIGGDAEIGLTGGIGTASSRKLS